MSKLTYEKVLNLILTSSEKFNRDLDKSIEKSRKEWDKRLEKDRKEWDEKLERERTKAEIEREKDRKRAEKARQKSEEIYNKKMNEIQGLFTSQWGKLLEAIVEPSALQLFQERGFKVTQTARRVETEYKGRNAEYDVVLTNGDSIIIVEVKSTCKVEDVKEFVEVLKDVPLFMRHYRDCNVYGAVAALTYDSDSDKFAEKNGMFVIKTKGEGFLEITNPKNFKPKIFVKAQELVR